MERILRIISGLVLAFLAVRFVLALTGADPAGLFAGLIYGLTHWLVWPFFWLFSYQILLGVPRFELETLVAMVVYAGLGFGAAWIMAGSRDI